MMGPIKVDDTPPATPVHWPPPSSPEDTGLLHCEGAIMLAELSPFQPARRESGVSRSSPLSGTERALLLKLSMKHLLKGADDGGEATTAVVEERAADAPIATDDVEAACAPAPTTEEPPPPLAPHVSEGAVFLSPNGRPYMRAFVEAISAAGLECRIESVDADCAMVRRLRRRHDGWGTGTSFSLFLVSHVESSA